MRSRAVKFYSRAPRYTLSPTDNRMLRFAPESAQGRSYTTVFLNISQTGLSFITDADFAPRMSDLIKIEIPLDGNQTIAWWARVIRLEEYHPYKWYMKEEDFDSENQILVAVTFHEMPEQHTQLIARTLDRKFAEQRAIERRERLQSFIVFFMSRTWQILLYMLAIAATFWFLHYMTKPDANYDAEKGAPWGERFIDLKIKREKTSAETE